MALAVAPSPRVLRATASTVGSRRRSRNCFSPSARTSATLAFGAWRIVIGFAIVLQYKDTRIMLPNSEALAQWTTANTGRLGLGLSRYALLWIRGSFKVLAFRPRFGITFADAAASSSSTFSSRLSSSEFEDGDSDRGTGGDDERSNESAGIPQRGGEFSFGGGGGGRSSEGASSSEAAGINASGWKD